MPSSNFSRWYHKSYRLDYVLVGVLLIVDGVLNVLVPVHKRYDEPDITVENYPYLPDIVPVWALLIFSFIGPVLFFFVFQV